MPPPLDTFDWPLLVPVDCPLVLVCWWPLSFFLFFLDRLPDGLESAVLERGTNFSTGEKQLLSFARALAFDPAVLVLDEATASVDPATEARIQEALATMLEGRTSIVIAHRLATVMACDRIFVLHHGALVEQGTHDELVAKEGGIYAALYRYQAVGGTLG